VGILTKPDPDITLILKKPFWIETN
jgi:hypothetical protein